jgi:hypothetical protein
MEFANDLNKELSLIVAELNEEASKHPDSADL